MPSGSPVVNQSFFVGIDLGTSGCRGCAIDPDGEVQAEAAVELPPPRREGPRSEQDPALWWQTVRDVLTALQHELPGEIAALAVDATSSTLLLTDAHGKPLGPGLMYNDARAVTEAEHIQHIAPPASGAHGASASLAKLLWLLAHSDTHGAAHALHQADWIAGKLLGRFGFSDENNALKLGYDPVERHWPLWIGGLGFELGLLPDVVPPGTALGRIEPSIASDLGLSPDIQIVSGTTDSIAAFLATGASQTGEAVTSLGSTLALKIISDEPVFAPQFGIYSHRLWDQWLAGGASNSGGAVLRQHFDQATLDALTPRLRPEEPTGLDYYPLPSTGERFPIADPTLAPRLEPRPDDDLAFFQGILEGIARIETQGYRRLHELGAPYPNCVYSVGGGANNGAWTRIRQRALGTPMKAARHTAAAYGAARLARRGIMRAAHNKQ